MDKTTYTMVCDVIASDITARCCNKENARQLRIYGQSYFDAIGDSQQETMTFDVCPDHMATMLQRTLQFLYNNDIEEFEAIMSRYFTDSPRKPIWRK